MSRLNELRVLHTIGQLIPGGVELRTLELIRHSAAEGIKHIICVTSGKRGTLDAEYEAAGAELHYMNIRSPRFAARFYRLLKSEAIDVVHAMLMYMSGYLLAIAHAARIPKRIAHFQSDGGVLKRSVGWRVRRQALRSAIDYFATDIVGLTPATLDIAWSRGWREDPRCRVVVNGVSPSLSRSAVPLDLVPLLSKNIVVHAGRGDLPTKNREKAIRVFSHYRRVRPESVLIFIGRDGRDAEQERKNLSEWKRLTESLGDAEHVFFLGEKESVFPYFDSSDVLLFTSKLEGLPGVMLEALAAGLPVLSSDVPGALFISEHSAAVEILDVEASDELWAERLLESDHKLSDVARNNIKAEFEDSRFNLDRAIQGYIQLWSS